MKFINFAIGIVALSIVVYNNLIQLTKASILDWVILGITIFVVSIYYGKNRGEINKLIK